MKKFFSLLTFLAVVFTVSAQTADEIIDNHIKAIGGAQKWNELNSMYSEMTTDMGGMKVPIKIWQQHMKGMRVEFEVQGMTGIQVVTDKDGWSLMPFMGQTKPEPTNEEALKSARSQLDIRGQLLDYKGKGSSVEYLGEDEDEGVEVYKIRLTDSNKTETTFFIDKENYLLIKAVSKVNFQGQEIDAVTKMSNYKDVGGILIPHSIDSMSTGKMEIVKTEINPAIAEDKFAMPKQ
ncbi:MAG TPA: hypothetical protein PLQ57_13980 [Saprospiraceae bacterium]|nr:hypothetical protein [Saprospiraceae bacterium]HRG65379.1 hypothetical protein [Saprospiraceae bacterium]